MGSRWQCHWQVIESTLVIAIDHATIDETVQYSEYAFPLLYFIVSIFSFHHFIEKKKITSYVLCESHNVNIRKSSKYIEILNIVPFVSHYWNYKETVEIVPPSILMSFRYIDV